MAGTEPLNKEVVPPHGEASGGSRWRIRWSELKNKKHQEFFQKYFYFRSWVWSHIVLFKKIVACQRTV